MAKTTETESENKAEVAAVIAAAYRVSEDLGAEIEAVLQDGRDHPLDEEHLRKLLTRVVVALKARAAKSGAKTTLDGSIEGIVDEVMKARTAGPAGKDKRRKRIELIGRYGIEPGQVYPRPMFHEKEIPMNSGWVKTTDISLWPDNERLEIHVAQFRHQHGRKPNSRELLDIMMSKMPLKGIDQADEFEIVDLARSIASNGVRKPPIIDLDGTLLDGNRRVTACYYILNTDEFDTEQKKNAEYAFVWQLTEYADDDDRDKVVVSLNFEKDLKKEWPEYIKARKVYAEYETMLGLMGTKNPTGKQDTEIRRQIARRFALSTNEVTRYVKMMGWADAFEGYHVGERGRDQYEVKHRTDDAFQYFDELSKGSTDGGVADTLKQDDTLRHAVFDLLFDERFRNWKQIRDLKHVARNDDARELLLKARNETNDETAEELLDNAISMAKTRAVEERVVGANPRIESFVKWLRELPVSAFTDQIRPENLRRLLDALELVKEMALKALKAMEAGNAGKKR